MRHRCILTPMKLLSDSQNSILLLLKKKITVSVDEATFHLGITKTAVRRHLLVMERRGLVERVQQRKERGRPSLAFRLTPSARRLFPNKEAEILSGLIKFLTESGNEELIEEFFKQYWEKRYESIQARLAKKKTPDISTRIQVLKEELEKEGFMPRSRVVQKSQQLTFQECHCPLESVVSSTRVPCHMEKRLISRVLNAPVTVVKLREDEDEGPCEYTLPIQKLMK